MLVALAAALFQIYQAQNIAIRCSCPKTTKFTKDNVTDFEVLEPRSGCDKTEVIFTVAKGENVTEKKCMDPTAKMGFAVLKCWENKNKNETRKHECLARLKRQEN